MYYSKSDIEQLEQRFRTNLINSLAGFKPANLIGSKNKAMQTNLAIFNSVMHIGANPALMGFIMRPTNVERHTYENIIETEYYTINNLTKSTYNKGHLTSARYERHESEFEFCGLTEEYLFDFHAPFVQESTLKIGLKLEDDVFIKLNNTRLIIGSIQHVQLNDDCLFTDGTIQHEKLNSVAINGLNSYYETAFLEQLPYAKPKH